LSKVSVVVGAANGSRIKHFIGTLVKGSTMGKMSGPKKKFQGFPHVFYILNFKRAFLGDMKRWWSRH
jgi:hypothetical protein